MVCLLSFLICYRLDNEECTNCKNDRDGEGDHPVLDEACDNEGNEGDTCNSNRVGNLSRHMVEVIALSTCGGHDSGIGNG